METKHLKLTIIGRVQGVGYRWFTHEQAHKFNIKGFVRNLINGNVEVLAYGPNQELFEFISILRQGPSFSNVSDIQIEELNLNLANYQSFEIKH